MPTALIDFYTSIGRIVFLPWICKGILLDTCLLEKSQKNVV
jgi:hypothetical protein